MKSRILGTFLMSAALMLGASKSQKPVTDTAIGNDLRQEIVAYSHYTVFDDVAYRVNDGHVSLNGVVTDPAKKTSIEKLARSIPGVTAVSDNIQALSNSLADNRIRAGVEHAIYSNPVFDHYYYEAQKPVRIIVNNGQVTLEGVVQSQLEKQVAAVNATAAAGPIVNNLVVA